MPASVRANAIKRHKHVLRNGGQTKYTPHRIKLNNTLAKLAKLRLFMPGDIVAATSDVYRQFIASVLSYFMLSMQIAAAQWSLWFGVEELLHPRESSVDVRKQTSVAWQCEISYSRECARCVQMALCFAFGVVFDLRSSRNCCCWVARMSIVAPRLRRHIVDRKIDRTARH